MRQSLKHLYQQLRTASTFGNERTEKPPPPLVKSCARQTTTMVSGRPVNQTTTAAQPPRSSAFAVNSAVRPVPLPASPQQQQQPLQGPEIVICNSETCRVIRQQKNKKQQDNSGGGGTTDPAKQANALVSQERPQPGAVGACACQAPLLRASAGGVAGGMAAATGTTLLLEQAISSLEKVDLAPESFSIVPLDKLSSLKRLTTASIGGMLGTNAVMAWCISIVGVNFVLMLLGLLGWASLLCWYLAIRASLQDGWHDRDWQHPVASLKRVATYVNLMALVAGVLAVACVCNTQVLLETLLKLQEHAAGGSSGAPQTSASWPHALANLSIQGRALFAFSLLLNAYNIFLIFSICWLTRFLILWVLKHYVLQAGRGMTSL